MKTRATNVSISEVENGYLITVSRIDTDPRKLPSRTDTNYVANDTAALFSILNDCYGIQAN